MYKDIAAADEYSVITPSDTVNLVKETRAIYVGAPGNISIVPNVGLGRAGTAVLFVSVPVGTTLVVSALRINATGTTAANLVALY